MKIRIIGACGSGKSTLARELSRKYNIAFYEMDNLIWDRSAENRRYPDEVRDSSLQAIVGSDAWIIEGAQLKPWTSSSILEADLIFVLHPHVLVRDYRIIKRFLLSRTGLQTWNYRQSFSNLCKMIVEWNHQYDVQDVIEMTSKHGKDVVVITNEKQAVEKINTTINLQQQCFKD
ncbi:shikimate kinase [Paenibacillus xylanexedens]|uniref:shikimate kinase n=1 Tax=Paenibacillus xylanexedens TaxID=528191 RepID=UPI0011AA0A92|nr:shikimate kinase [Paenibacillus xylanexedens]